MDVDNVIDKGVHDWRHPNPKKIDRAENLLKAMGVKREQLPSNDVFPLFTFREISSIPKEFRVPITLELQACTADERAQDVQENGYLVYLAGLVWGMMLPLHPFQIEILNFYNLIPAQVIPKGWWGIRIFISICERAKIAPSLLVFRSFFFIKKYESWYSIYQRKVIFPESADNDKGWRHEFFRVLDPQREHPDWYAPKPGPPPKVNELPKIWPKEEEENLEKFLKAYKDAVGVKNIFEDQPYPKPSIIYVFAQMNNNKYCSYVLTLDLFCFSFRVCSKSY